MLPNSNVPTGVTQWGGRNGPFHSLANWPLTVCLLTPWALHALLTILSHGTGWNEWLQ